MARVIPRPPLPKGPFLVVGLARSGMAAALALRELGETVVGTDSRPVAREVGQRLQAAGVTVRDGKDGTGLGAGGGGGGGETGRARGRWSRARACRRRRP